MKKATSVRDLHIRSAGEMRLLLLLIMDSPSNAEKDLMTIKGY